MAWQLTVEVRDHAPRMSLGERAVLLAIAEQVRVGDIDTRRTPPLSRDDLARFAGLKPSGLRAALRRLRDRGLEVRVPLDGRDASDGRPMIAVPGVLPTYQLPHFVGDGLDALLVDAPPAGQTDSPEGDEAASGDTSGQDCALRDDSPTALDGDAAQPVDNSVSSGDKGGTTCLPAVHKGVTEYPGRGARDDSLRGARDDSPSRPGVPVRAGARVREAAPVDNQAGSTAPGIAAALDALGPVPPRCLDHTDLGPSDRVPSCPDCAGLARAHRSRRTEIVRGEARRRRRCRSCDDHGWVVGPDGHALGAPARRCAHPSIPGPTSTNTRESERATR